MRRALVLVPLLLACGAPVPSTQDSGPHARIDAPPAGRATSDRPDDVTGPQVHVFYVVPADGEDRQLDLDGTLARSVAAWNGWLGRELGGAGFRLDTAGGELDITFVRLSQDEASLTARGAYVRDALEDELSSRGDVGPQHPDKLAAVYYDGGSTWACGGGAWPPALVGRVAAMYLRGTPPGAPPCAGNPFSPDGVATGYLEFAMVHEILHTVGAVATCAPNHALDGHVGDDPTDLMYAGPLPWQPSRLDVGRNDYAGHGRADCLDLTRSALLGGDQRPPGW